MLVGIGCLSLFALMLYEYLLSDVLVHFSVNPLIIQYARQYFFAWIAMYFATLLFTSGAAMMRGLELYHQQTAIIIVSCVLNAIFSPLLMFEPIGLGVSGAVYGTVLAQFCAIGLFVRCIYRKAPYVFEQFAVKWKNVLSNVIHLLRMAVVTATSAMFWPISVLISTYYMSKLGDVEVAMMGVISKVQPLLMTPVFAISLATGVAVSKFFQQSNWSKITQYFRIAVGLMVVWQLSVAVILWWVREPFSSFMLPHTPEAVGLLQWFLCLIPATVIGRGLIFLLSQTLPALNLAPKALVIDFVYALCLHTFCYLVGYWVENFEIVIDLLAILNVVGVVVFGVVVRQVLKQ